MTVGVRDLKAHLSEHLKRVRRGARLAVTDRGRVVARLIPAEDTAKPAWALRLVAEGVVHWAGGKPAGLTPRVKSRGKPTSEMVIEDRR
jgi:prevent-host-death family protein